MSAVQTTMPLSAPSPTLATPRPSSLALRVAVQVDHAAVGISVGQVDSAPAHRQESTLAVDLSAQDDSPSPGEMDGRMTPTASSSSSNIPSPNPTTISLLSQNTQSTGPTPSFTASISQPAEIGLGNLQAEEQLKVALQSKDRMFLLVLARELEAFVSKASTQPTSSSSPGTPSPAGPGSSTMAALGSATNIGVTPSSKFQRMLVYKAAEWYGIKAVPGVDGQMVVGVLGALDEKSTSLRLSELVPAAPSPPQKFRIMQRATPQNGSASDRSSPAEGVNGEGRSSRPKTLEEREAAYAAAREKIYGKSTGDDAFEDVPVLRPGQSGSTDANEDEEEDPVPRQLYGQGAGVPPFEVVYPSLYDPPKPELSVPAPPAHQTDQYPSHGYQPGYNPYPQQVDMNGYSTVPGYPSQPLHPAGYGPAQTYANPAQNMAAYNGYAPNWGPGPRAGVYQGQPISIQQPYVGPGQQPSGMGPQGWPYPPPPMGPTPQPGMQMSAPGMPYPSSYGYPVSHAPPIPPQRQGMYPALVQPTPMRPQIHPHSSASSSISSRSYQDGSRPHSRGSTTSTRSAASSVRLGAMYPATQGPGYRQKAMKGQGMNGLTGLNLGTGVEKPRPRAHSPSSATTSSSRSSRQTNSIQLATPAPGQHQLPQRPDWAANNVPYHPSPMPGPSNGRPMLPIAGPSAAEFPPLLRHGQGTNAEPMQVERAKAKQTNGTVWNGGAVKALQHVPVNSPVSPRMTVVHAPGRARTPVRNVHNPAFVNGQAIEDPDFPRRQTKAAPTLYDPSAPRATAAGQGNGTASRPSSVNTNPSSAAASEPTLNGMVSVSPAITSHMTPEEVIEAKLAAVSVSAGVSIGPPPNRAGASYAKIVRRD